jgi:hypothetical protein
MLRQAFIRLTEKAGMHSVVAMVPSTGMTFTMSHQHPVADDQEGQHQVVLAENPEAFGQPAPAVRRGKSQCLHVVVSSRSGGNENVTIRSIHGAGQDRSEDQEAETDRQCGKKAQDHDLIRP